MPGAGQTVNTNWTSISVGTYKSIIRNGLTGANRLDLPLVSQGATPIDLIKRAPEDEDTANLQVYAQRFYSQASLRILLSDRAADITGSAGNRHDGCAGVARLAGRPARRLHDWRDESANCALGWTHGVGADSHRRLEQRQHQRFSYSSRAADRRGHGTARQWRGRHNHVCAPGKTLDRVYGMHADAANVAGGATISTATGVDGRNLSAVRNDHEERRDA